MDGFDLDLIKIPLVFEDERRAGKRNLWVRRRWATTPQDDNEGNRVTLTIDLHCDEAGDLERPSYVEVECSAYGLKDHCQAYPEEPILRQIVGRRKSLEDAPINYLSADRFFWAEAIELVARGQRHYRNANVFRDTIKRIQHHDQQQCMRSFE